MDRTKGKIDVCNLHVVYNGDAHTVQAVKDLSFSVASQEFLCLLGTTGCGKSTILNVMAGFVKPSKGDVLLDGEVIKLPGPERGVVFQRHALFPWKTVKENV